MEELKLYTVKEVCLLTKVNRLDLFRYEKAGLLLPSGVANNAGYKLYSEDDLERLWKILFFKELGEKPSGIKVILEKNDFELSEYLEYKILMLQEERKEINNLEIIIHDLLQQSLNQKDLLDSHQINQLVKEIKERKNKNEKEY